jgi:amino acid adenylation domain-containing protein
VTGSSPKRALSPQQRAAIMQAIIDRNARQREQRAPLAGRAAGLARPPLSFAQEQLWFLNQLDPGESTYNMSQCLRLSGPLDVDALRQALDHLTARHAPLRTTFPAEGGVPYQRIEPPGPAAVTYHDLSGLDPGQAGAELARLAAAEAGRPFDLAAGPLSRAMLARLGPGEHVLVQTAHHIVADGWSMGLLGAELSQVYRAVVAGREPGLAELAVQYADFAVWQREWLRGEVLEESLAYWEKQLSGIGVLELPSDRPRPALPRYTGDLVTGEIPGELLAGLAELARSRGVSLFMVLMAVYAVVLARYTGVQDIPVGTTVLGRNRPELENLVGLFINEVVLRLDVSGDPSFEVLLERVKQVTLAAYDHQDAPFAKVVERCAPVRDPGRNPLFNVFLQFLSGGPGRPELHAPGLSTEVLDIYQGQVFDDFSLTFIDETDHLDMRIEYSVELFDRWRVEAFAGHFVRVAGAVVADPGVVVSGVGLLSEGERSAVLAAGCGPGLEFRAEPVHVLVAERAAVAPGSVAAVCRGERLSYGELDGRAAALGCYLRSLGVGHGDVVAVALERGLEGLVALLGVLKAGAGFVVLDTENPSRRLEFILADTGAVAVVTSVGLLGKLPEPGRWVAVCVDRDAGVIAAAGQGAGGELVEWASADSLAYVLYTSGSTGRPKGVLIEHRALMLYLAAFSELVGTGPGARVLQYPSMFFDLSMAEIFGTLISGGTVVVVPPEVLLAPKELAELMRAERVTYAGAPPAMMALLEPEPYPELECVLVGGEPFTGELVNQWNLPGRRFINAYGPTETVVTCTTKTCEHITWRSSPPIGRPMPGRRVYVVDRWGNLAPVGVPGELLIGGEAGLARGYLNSPALTAQRFVPDPFAAGARVYRSGDLVRWNRAGELEFLHRIDHQVKLRGLRIELEEIEAILETHPKVGQACVLLREDDAGEKYLTGYISHTGTEPGVGELRAHLAAELPSYMIPTAWVILAALPLGLTGKVNRAALPAPAKPARASEPPRTPTEEHVAAVFADILALPAAGAHDNFFELGGNSLQAIRVISRLDDIFHTTLSVRHFYGSDATVASVAALIDGQRGTAGAQTAAAGRASCLLPLSPPAGEPPLYCVHAVSGSPYSYAGLARLLGGQRQLLAFAAPGLDDGRQPLTTIADLASEYVAALTEHQSEGPYLLFGWSLGGVVCYEMARQMLARGIGPQALILADCVGPPLSGDQRPGPDLPDEAELIGEFVAELAHAAGRPAPVARAHAGGDGGLDGLLSVLKDAGLVDPDAGPGLLRRRYEVFRANMLALLSYRPATPYPGPLTLLRAAESPDTRQSWQPLAATVGYRAVPGDHYSMWSPEHLPVLAAAVRELVDQAGTDPAAGPSQGAGAPS